MGVLPDPRSYIKAIIDHIIFGYQYGSQELTSHITYSPSELTHLIQRLIFTEAFGKNENIFSNPCENISAWIKDAWVKTIVFCWRIK